MTQGGGEVPRQLDVVFGELPVHPLRDAFPDERQRPSDICVLDGERENERAMLITHFDARPHQNVERLDANGDMETQDGPTQVGCARDAHARIGDERDGAHFVDRDEA